MTKIHDRLSFVKSFRNLSNDSGFTLADHWSFLAGPDQTAVDPVIQSASPPHSLASGNFSQDWTNIGLITAADNWDNVPSIVGYRGDGQAVGTGVDPQTVTGADLTAVIDVNANQTNVLTFNTGGVTEFHLANPTIALAGSGTAKAPYIVIYLDSTGRENVNVAFTLRDLEGPGVGGTMDNAIQQIAVQFRTSPTSAWTNLPAGYVADATTGPSLNGPDIPVSVLLPVAANNVATLQVRILTTDATGNDEWVGIDDIVVSSAPIGAGSPGELSINDVTLVEGDSGLTAFTFTVTRANGDDGAVGATWTLNAPGGGNADAGDFDGAQLFTGTVAFADGDTSETITINVQGDDLVETDEAFTVTLSAPTGGATIADGSGAGTITNDDAAGAFSVDDATITEGNGGTTPMTFTVTRAGGDDGASTIGYSVVAPGGAGFADSADFAGGTIFSGSVIFADGETSKAIVLNVVGDTDFEPDETFEVQLTSASSGSIADGLGIGTIDNDDAAPAGTLSIDDVSLAEGDTGSTTTFTFTVTRSAGSAGAIMADYVISAPGGTGNASTDDFVSGAVFSGQVAFADGETSQTISIDVEGDVDFEADEAFTITLSNATGGAGIGDGTGAGTIVNDDLQPPAGSVSIADASIVEGDSGTQILVLNLTRIGGTGAFDVNYATSNGGTPGNASASAGSDYVAASGIVSFASGQNTATIQITINGDTFPELDEEFTVTLSGATNGATISDPTAIATITSDDPQPASTRVFEEDFAGFTAGGFAPNPTATQLDSDVWRVVGLSDIANPAYGFTATTGDFARGTIGSNDPTTAGVYSPTSNPALIIQPTGAELDVNGFIEARIENNSGSTATGFDIAFDWSYRNSGGRASSLQLSYSTDGTNFIAVPAAAFTTPADAVPLTGAFALQPETVSLTGLAVAAGAFIYLRWTHASSAGSGNRDEVGIDNLTVDATGGATGPLVSVSDVSVNEAAGTMTFTVTRANAAAGVFTVDYETANGTATAGSDYVATSGTLSFAANQVSATVTVTVNDDGTPELDETLFLNLSDPSGATIADGQGVGTIVNDDGAPIQVSINDVSIVEGDSGTQNLVFTVTRTGGSGAFDVDFETVDGTAISIFGPGQDYVTTTGTINFLAGQNSATISVPILGDTLAEPNESFQVVLTSATNDAIIVDGSGTGTIVNDEPIFIHDIQGTAYFSPILAGDGISGFNTASTTAVTVRAIVTAVDDVGPRQGYYLTEEITDWDTNTFTSEGIFVMTRNDAGVGSVVSGVSVGDLVQLSANVMEYQAFSTMPRTVLVNSTGLSIISTGNALPTITLTNMPNEVLTAVTPNYAESSDGLTFDASLYALSYFETVEGMLVTVPNMVVADGFVSTSGGDPFLQAYSLDSANPDQINSRGGYTIAGDPPIGPPDTAGTGDDTVQGGRHLHDGDVNPDVIELDFTDFATSAPVGLLENASMGDQLGDVTGIIDFDFTDRKLFVTQMEPGGFVDGGMPVQETTALGADPRSLTVATFNVENLDALDSPAKFAGLANAIANNLKSPDIICIEEIQDNNGPSAGSADASLTWQILVDAVNAATGKNYQWVDEQPNGSEGGEPGGNIRVGFLYNMDRVQLGDLDANATLAERRAYTDRIGDGVRDAGDLIAFSDNMLGAEINPTDWGGTRRSLLGEFNFNGNTIFVTANHWPAKGGSGEFWQLNQNLEAGQPINSGWAQRNAVAQDVYSVLNLIEGSAPDAGIVAGGDFNDFYFYRPLTTVTGHTMADGTARVGGARFENLTLTLPEAERYTYTFDGRSQAIDHIIANGLLGDVATYDVVHLNTGYNPSDSPALSDHDPGLSSFDYREFAEVLSGTAGADSIEGFGGDDVITGGFGNDDIDGGAGEDTAVYAGNLADYTIVGEFDSGGNLIGFQSVTDNVPGNGDEGTDTLDSVEILQFADTTLTLSAVFSVELYDENDVLVGTFINIQDAIDAADTDYRIEVGAGTYEENLVVDVEGLTINGEPGAILQGSFLTDNAVTGPLNVWLKTAAAYTGVAGVGITVAADDVTIGNLTVTAFLQGVLLGDGSDGTILDGVALESNFTGIHKPGSAAVTGFEMLDGSISDGHLGLDIVRDSGSAGIFDGVTIDGTSFADLNRKGIYAEALSNATIANFTMTNVGEFGGITATGALGAGGNGINLNLKYDDYANIVIEDFTMTDVGSSDRDGAVADGHQNGGAIVVTARDDAPSYSGDPATLTNVVIRDGSIDGTSTGIQLGEPGKQNATPDLSVENVAIADAQHSLRHGEIGNQSAATMTVTGTAGNDSLIASGNSDGPFDIDGAGGDDILTTGSAADTLDGGAGSDALSGLDGDDTLDGGAQNDLLDGGAGFDTADFADSFVTYTDTLLGWLINSSEGNDFLENVEAVTDGSGRRTLLVGATGLATLQEALDAAANTNQVRLAAGSYGGTVNYAASGLIVVGQPGAQQSVTYNNIVSGVGITVIAANLADTVATDDGDDRVFGNGGIDNISTGAGNDILNGGDGADVLSGGAGNDSLTGGAGNDAMSGGADNDIYHVTEAGDVVTEAAAGGTDIVYSSVSYSLNDGSEVESLGALSFTGTTALNFAGNGLANTLLGNDGNNQLNGRGGADTMVGRAGNDTYLVDNAGDGAFEAAGGGTDAIYTAVSYTLAGGQELEGLSTITWELTDAIDLTGNGLNNQIIGNAGMNRLDGKGGNDALHGREGADTFAFTTALGATNVDNVHGFVSGQDRIELDNAVFATLPDGALNANAFVIGAAATAAAHRIVYNSANGQLFYDSDGVGGAAATLFAVLNGAPLLAHSDFTVI